MDPETKSLQDAVNKLTKQVDAHEKRINVLESKKAPVQEKTSTDKPEIKAPLEIPKKTFKVGKQEFRFTSPRVNIPGRGIVLAEEALADPEILDQLVKMNSGVIREVF